MRRRDIETERISALNRLKRRDMHDLLRSKCFVLRDFAKVIVMTQIRMTVAECIRDLGNNSAQDTCVVVAKPKANGVKHMAQQARLRQQINTSGQFNVMSSQNRTHPAWARTSLWRTTVIAVLQRHQARSVPRKQRRTFNSSLGIHKHVINRIPERIFDRTTPAVVRLAAYMFDNAHSAAKSSRSSAFRLATTSIALDRPSSWKPFFIHAPQNHVRFDPFIATAFA